MKILLITYLFTSIAVLLLAIRAANAPDRRRLSLSENAYIGASIVASLFWPLFVPKFIVLCRKQIKAYRHVAKLGNRISEINTELQGLLLLAIAMQARGEDTTDLRKQSEILSQELDEIRDELRHYEIPE